MEAELQSKLTSILNWVEETAKVTEGFVIEQTPLYIQELLAWNFWSSLIWFCLGATLMICGAISLRKIFVNFEKWDREECHKLAISIIIAVIGLLFGGPMLASNFEWLKIAVAPRVFLLEYVTQAVK
jgi:H+/Cl- antiporter ClcA